MLSDIWGVVHNGLESFPEACAALHSYRQQGGVVILLPLAFGATAWATRPTRPNRLRRDRRAP